MARMTEAEHPLPAPPLLGAALHLTRQHGRRVIKVALALLLAITIITGLGAAYTYHRLTKTITSYAGPHFNKNQNAVWLEHVWSGSPQSPAEYGALATLLRSEGIAFVFAHVGPLDSAGTIPIRLAPNAASLATALHARVPGLKILAWIGQLEAASGAPASETVNLANSSVRAAIVNTAASFVRNDGFDGVHFDIEPIQNNNPHYLDLLIETRAGLPAGALISVSAQKWAPSAHVANLLYRAGRGGQWWTSYYYAAVAAHVDQMAILTYDSGMPTARAYEIFVQQEAKHILAAVRTASHPPEVLIGVPTYAGDDAWFHDSAENMTTALTGVIASLNSDGETQPFVGVAIYRLAVTTPADWSAYDRMWLGRNL